MRITDAEAVRARAAELRGGGNDRARRLAGMFTELDRHRHVLEQRATLGTADMRLLWLLTDGRSRTLREIAKSLKLEQSTINRQVNVAMKAGLLTRDRPDGGGPYEFSASPTGLAEFERNLNVTLEAYRAGLDALGDDGEKFLELMGGYLDAYSAAVTRPAKPGAAAPARSAG